MADVPPADDGAAADRVAGDRLGRGAREFPPLEAWPEDEGSAPHARPEFPSITRLLLRASPRVALGVLLGVLYASAEGSARTAFLLSWIVVVGSMLLPRWRRYVETGQRGRRPTGAEATAEESGPDTGGTDGEAPDPRDAWEVPEELPGEPASGSPTRPRADGPDPA